MDRSSYKMNPIPKLRQNSLPNSFADQRIRRSIVQADEDVRATLQRRPADQRKLILDPIGFLAKYQLGSCFSHLVMIS